MYCNLSQLFKFLHPEQSVYVLTPHGLDGFAAPHSVPEMAADYLAEIQAVQKEGPCYLGGYSFGGLIILEVAVMLKQMGHRVAFLGILDTRFGHVNEGVPTNRMAELEDVERNLNEYGRIPQSLRMRYFPLTFSRAGINHHPGAYAGSLTYFKAQDNDRTDKYRDGCEDFILGNYCCHEVGGDHSSMLERPHVKYLAGLLQQCLDQASGDGDAHQPVRFVLSQWHWPGAGGRQFGKIPVLRSQQQPLAIVRACFQEQHIRYASTLNRVAFMCFEM